MNAKPNDSIAPWLAGKFKKSGLPTTLSGLKRALAKAEKKRPKTTKSK